MRTLPHMTIINPADAVEAEAAVLAAAEYCGPVYMRFGRLAVPVINDSSYKFEWGKGIKLTDGKDVTIFATGLMVNEALKAYEQLKQDGIDARIVNIHTIKPIDRDIIINSAKETGCIVTAEEHNYIGGLGSAVAEVVCDTVPVPVVRVGVEDQFGVSGPGWDLLKLYGLHCDNIAAKARIAVERKRSGK